MRSILLATLATLVTLLGGACSPMVSEHLVHQRDEATRFKVPREFAPERRRARAPAADYWVEVDLSDGSGGRMLAGELSPGLPPSAYDLLEDRGGDGSLQVLFQVHINEQGVAHLAQWVSPKDAPESFVQHFKDHIATWRFEPFILEGRAAPRLVTVFLRYPGVRVSSRF